MLTSETPDELGGEQPFISHLIELRNRLIRMLVAVGLVFLALFPFANDIYTAVAAPIMAKLPDGASMIATQIASPFLTPFKLALMVAVFVTAPYLLYQLWAFVAPGLYRHEKRLAVPLLISSIVLFYLGMAFAYFVVFPLVFAFFASVTPQGVTQMPDIAFYLDFILKLFFAFGVAFEIPIATILLVAIGAVTPEQLARQRPYVIVGVFVVGMVLTPPDVISQTLLAVPMWLLFELGILFSRILVTPRGAPERPEDGGGPDGDRDPPPQAFLREDEDGEIDRDEASGGGDPGLLEAEEAPVRASAEVADPVTGKLERIKSLRDTDGDLEEVRRLLYEVLGEGDVDQRIVAQNILDQLDTP
ncbi:twin arginine targeting protein translocase subunit TatC [Thioflavicoccus mobilis 8321]|uniref:Sec-independent protein translocase protein TatC n=1 Tax=Thioflavicoccus mobilis 8321 TaxID=765912 RepID=L0GZ11_9GAMM|nr:twin-arginine translocase subunit TatC [Thioflavicoccus mobilis]AGA90620.1 twin arginine targeting protein translocase subunit TatC [Thioflavicoccus mobilis 8321]